MRALLERAGIVRAFGLRHGASAQAQKNDKDSNATAGSSAHPPANQDPNYVIGGQDVLDISVWKEPDLTRSVPVRPDGKISLPLLNDVQAAGAGLHRSLRKITEL